MINSTEAFNQPLDFTQIYPYSTCVTDIDGLVRLNNDKLVLIEVKKNTPKHEFKNIEQSAQYKQLKYLADMNKDIYLIYATHDLDINSRVLVTAQDCIIQDIYNCSKKIEKVPGESLEGCLKRLSKKEKYVIGLRYPSGTQGFARRGYKDKKWFTTTLDEQCIFISKMSCEKYITDRAKKVFNKGNKYTIFKLNEHNKFERCIND